MNQTTELAPWARHDLQRSGLSPELAADVGIHMVAPQDLKNILGFCPGADVEGYAIPFRDPMTNEPMRTKDGRPFIRVKFKHPVPIGGSDAKYCSPMNGGNRAYIPPEAHAAALRGEALVISEGEKKALCACHHGIPCIGLVGVYGFQDGGTKDLLAELKPYFGNGHEIRFVLDSDSWCNTDIARAAHRLAQIASLRGCDFKVLVLSPSTTHANKVGLDDAILERGVDFVRQELLQSAQAVDGNLDDLCVAWLRTGAAARTYGIHDLRALADEILRKGYFGKYSGACRRRIDDALTEVAPALLQTLKTVLGERLSEEFANVPVPEQGGVGIANNRYVRVPDQPCAVKVDAVDSEIVWCYWPDSAHASRPYPRRLLEVAERPSSSAQNGQSGGRPRGPSPTDIANAFLAQPHLFAEGVCLLRVLRGQWFLWDGARYDKIQEEDVRAQVMAFLRQHPLFSGVASTKTLTDVMNQLRAADTCALPSTTQLPVWLGPDGIRPAKGWVAMNNGAVNFENIARMLNGDGVPDHEMFQAITPTLMTPFVLDYAFEAEAQCSKFLAYLDDVQPDEEAQRLLQMMVGLCLVPDTRYNVFFMLHGTGGEGKSVFLSIMHALVGPANVCQVPFSKFGDKFSVGLLTEALVNIIGEGDSQLPRDVGLGRVEGLLKDVTDGGLLPVEKKFQEPCSARATARCIAACNEMPSFYDRSDGIWDRMRIIPFTQRIRGTERENPVLRAEIIADELPGILQWALCGLAKLRRLNRFPELPAGAAMKLAHRATCDHEREFLEMMCEAGPQHTIPTQGLYLAYKAWMSQRGYHPLGEGRFATSITRVFPQARRERVRTDDGKQPHCWIGLKLREGVA